MKQLVLNLFLCVLMLMACDSMPMTSLAQTSQKGTASVDALIRKWTEETKQKYREAWTNRCIVIGDRKMPYDVKVYGTEPTGGFPLYISLHGGGNSPSEVNDQQWENQKVLYTPAHAVYIAPRAPYDDWDMWFKPALDQFYRVIIQMAVAYLNVNPDKVYLMGYSAGGDGVWRMAPRMADAWAAASMMAGHPGDVQLLNLRNTPFMIWCGALDSAYNRNEEDRLRGLVLDSLQKDDPQGYIHETHIVEGKGHWMDRVDTVAVSWMARYVRNPYPKKIVWRQEEVVQRFFYWIGAPEGELQRGRTVRVQLDGNTVNIEQCDYSGLTLFFNDEMLDLDRNVSIMYEGKTVFEGKLKRSESLLQQTLNERGDKRYMFSAMYSFKKPT